MTSEHDRERSRAVEHLLVLAGYLVTTLVMTYPVVRSLGGAIPMDRQIPNWYPGDGDPWHLLWAAWYVARALATFPPPLFWTDLVFYPIGLEMPFITGIGVVLFPMALLAPLLGVPLTYNLLWLASFVAAGYTMYLLARTLVADRLVAFVCGHVFMFSAYRMAHALEHLPLLVASCLIPLFALCLLRIAERPTTGRWVAAAVVLALSAGIWWYCTIALLIYAAIFALVRLPGLRRHVSVAQLRGAAVAAVVLAVVASPFVLPMALSPARDGILKRPLAESSLFGADLLAFFVPSPTNPVFGRWTAPVYREFTGNPYEQTVYLGWVVLALAAWGTLRAPWAKTRLFVVGAVTFGVLALGPFLHVAGRDSVPLDGAELSLPLPYVALHYVPLVSGMRVPSRFAELAVFCLTILAGYGLAAVSRRAAKVMWRVALVGVVVLGVTIETAAAPFPTAETRVPRIYAEIGARPEPFTILELPLDWRIIKYHYYQSIHGKRLLVGHPVRSREKYSVYPAGVPLIPLLKEPKRLLEEGAPAEARRDAERLVAFFDVRHVLLHREYLEPPLFDALDRFVGDHFPHVQRRTDGDVVAYRLRPADAAITRWPDDYVVDFGSNREFVLLSGWSHDERAGATTFQWSSDDRSSMYLHLTEPADRLLELRVSPLTYPGAPPQTVAVSVNGRPQERLTLEPGWASYRLTVPAGAQRVGLNELTFTYGYARAPAHVVPGSDDTRRLAVAFDSVSLRRVTSR